MALIQIPRKAERPAPWLSPSGNQKRRQMSAVSSRSACAGFREIQFRFLLLSYLTNLPYPANIDYNPVRRTKENSYPPVELLTAPPLYVSKEQTKTTYSQYSLVESITDSPLQDNVIYIK